MSRIDTRANRQALLSQLRITLTLIERLDPSNPANHGRWQKVQEPEAYRMRNAAIYKAVGLAVALDFPAGVTADHQEAGWMVAYVELPDAGQVSWHLPEYATAWDGHDTEEKYARCREFAGVTPRRVPR